MCGKIFPSYDTVIPEELSFKIEKPGSLPVTATFFDLGGHVDAVED
jgi:hypothetical protein